MKTGFTLAEVLISLGIIGVVAAMTLPVLIQKHKNEVVETRLKNFYSTINQALTLAENDYGDIKYWYEDVKGAEFDNDGKPIPGSSKNEKWFRKYVAPYMKVTKIESRSDGSFIAYFSDGSAVRPWAGANRDWFFYPGNPKNCLDKGDPYVTSGKCSFSFLLIPLSTDPYHQNKKIEPYRLGWNGDIKKLYSDSTYACDGNGGFPHYCTAIIQMNGWKIPDDYPHKVSY